MPWGGTFDIDKKLQLLNEEERLTHAPDFWNDPKRAERILKQIKEKKTWTDLFKENETAVEDAAVLLDFFKAGDIPETEVDTQYKKAVSMIEDLEFKNMLSGEEDNLDAVLTINSGAGGTESQDWAEMLMRMYIRWGERHGMKVTEIERTDGDGAGIKSATL